jgi:hypothetical protein
LRLSSAFTIDFAIVFSPPRRLLSLRLALSFSHYFSFIDIDIDAIFA